MVRTMSFGLGIRPRRPVKRAGSKLPAVLAAASLVCGTLTIAGLLVVSAAGGERARQALTRAQANAIAIRVLHPQADKGDVVLFGLPKPLATGSFVVPADPPRGGPGRHARVRLRRLSGPAWLFWLDREPEAFFSHPSEYLLVDGSTGRVLQRAKLGWYPAVNGKPPAFVATRAGYASARYRVFTRQRRTTSSVSGPPPESRRSVVPAAAFKDDCVLMVGDYTEWHFSNDYPGLEKWATSVGLRTFFATPNGPTTKNPGNAPTDDEDLPANVKPLVEKQGCKDVLVFLAGHGSKDGVPFVATGDTVISGSTDSADTLAHGITPAAIEKTLRQFPTTTFKLKITSCYSGRFLDALTTKGKVRDGNLLVVEVSAPADSTSRTPAEKHRNNPDQVSWFMNQNLTGLRAWTSSESEVASSVALGGSLLAHALERAFVLGRDANADIRERNVPPLIAVGATTVAAGNEYPSATVKTYALSGEFKQPWQVTWAGTGTKTAAIVFSDRGGNQVGALDPVTGKASAFSLKVIKAPNAVTVIDDYRYAVGGTNGVAIFDRHGSGLIRELQMDGSQIANVAVGPDGKLWLTNIVNGQIVAIKTPYSGPADITKLDPLAGCRPTGIVPGVTDIVVACQQSNDLRILDPGTGKEIRKVALPDPASGAQEAKPAPGGAIALSGFATNRIYAFTPKDSRVRAALTGAGPAVPLVTGLGVSHARLFAKRTGTFDVGVPHYKAGGFTLATFPTGTSRQLAILQGRNLVGSAHGPDCSILVADATPGQPAIHKIQFSYAKRKGRLQTCVTAVAPDFLARVSMPFFSTIPTRPKAVEVSLTGASSAASHGGTTFAQRFRISTSVTATAGAKTYKPGVKVTDTGPDTRIVRITSIREGTKAMTLTVNGRTELPLSIQINVAALY